MNSQLAVVVVIDVEAALIEDTLVGNCYLIDNNRFRGSSGEGSDQLITFVEGNRVMNWLVLPADIFNATSIPYLTKIGGEAVEKGIMSPKVYESPEFDTRGLWWGGNVVTNQEGLYRYILTYNVGGKEMDFVSYIYAKPAFSNYGTIQEEASLQLQDQRQHKSYKFIRPRQP